LILAGPENDSKFSGPVLFNTLIVTLVKAY
jgi:hypothetical protein